MQAEAEDEEAAAGEDEEEQEEEDDEEVEDDEAVWRSAFHASPKSMVANMSGLCECWLQCPVLAHAALVRTELQLHVHLVSSPAYKVSMVSRRSEYICPDLVDLL